MKNIYDYKHVKSVSAVTILYKGKEAGKIIANWSDNPNGSVCTVMVDIYEGPLKREYDSKKSIAQAGGCGYCKLSQAVGNVLGQVDMMAAGMTRVRRYFEDNGYTYITVI